MPNAQTPGGRLLFCIFAVKLPALVLGTNSAKNRNLTRGVNPAGEIKL